MLADYPIEVSRVRVLNHLFNTTFRVDSPQGKFALRINTNSKREPEEMNAEVAWVDALARETDLWVPAPQRTEGGELIVECESAAMGRRLRGVLYSWLPGPDVWRTLDPRIAEAMGAATAKLHQHGRGFKFPEGARLHPLKDPYFGYPYQLREAMPNLDHSLFERTFDLAVPILERLEADTLMPLHYDVHMGNVKWSRGRLSVFDFDDSLMGHPAFDAYVTVFYLRSREGWPELEARYWQGLGSSPEAMGVTKEEFEILVASRGILLANEMFRWGGATPEGLAVRMAGNTEKRLQHFFETGVFDLRVALL